MTPAVLTFDYNSNLVVSDVEIQQLIIYSLVGNGMQIEGNVLQVITHGLPMAYGLTRKETVLYMASSQGLYQSIWDARADQWSDMDCIVNDVQAHGLDSHPKG